MHDTQIALVVRAALSQLLEKPPFWDNLEILTGKVKLYRSSGGNPNTAQVCRDVHDFWLGSELLRGAGHDSSEHLPFNFLSKERQVAEFLTRNIVISLLQLWTEEPLAAEEQQGPEPLEPELLVEDAPPEEKIAE